MTTQMIINTGNVLNLISVCRVAGESILVPSKMGMENEGINTSMSELVSKSTQKTKPSGGGASQKGKLGMRVEISRSRNLGAAETRS